MSHLYNLSFRTLRFYEEKGLLTPIRIGEQRLYTNKERTRLELILTGKRLRFSLYEIYRLIQEHQNSIEDSIVKLLDEGAIWRQLRVLESQRAHVEKALSELTAALKRDSL